jgi:hypothetical protein
MECHRCRGLMVVDYYIDMEDDQGTHWLRAWRCMACGEVISRGLSSAGSFERRSCRGLLSG